MGRTFLTHGVCGAANGVVRRFQFVSEPDSKSSMTKHPVSRPHRKLRSLVARSEEEAQCGGQNQRSRNGCAPSFQDCRVSRLGASLALLRIQVCSAGESDDRRGPFQVPFRRATVCEWRRQWPPPLGCVCSADLSAVGTHWADWEYHRLHLVKHAVEAGEVARGIDDRGGGTDGQRRVIRPIEVEGHRAGNAVHGSGEGLDVVEAPTPQARPP
jgi:hypothetical protein